MARAFEIASERPVPYKIGPRRVGDIAQCYADPSLAARELSWRATRDLVEMCEDTWRWQSMNPNGFGD
jgi:UDP-glucose 4-epimerase